MQNSIEESKLEVFKPKKASFVKKKNQIKKMVEEGRSTRIERFKTLEEKGFILKNKVSVQDFNEQMREVSKCFISLRNGQSKIYSTLTQIYNTFDELDKTYINSIVDTIGVVEKTTDKLKKNEQRIKRTGDALSTVAKNAKEKMIVSDIKGDSEEIFILKKELEKANARITELENKIEKFLERK